MARMTKAERDAAQQRVADAIEHLPADYLDCRDPGIRHQWQKTSDFHAIPAAQVGRKLANLGRTEECLRCGTVKNERFILIEGTIRKVGQFNEYPEGYLLAGLGVPRGMKRSEVVWSENYRRAMETLADQANGTTGTVVKMARGKSTKTRGRR